MPRSPRILATLAAIAALAACSGTSGTDTVTVLAASSLAPAFGRLEVEFEATHPDVDVIISYGGSHALARQMIEGAPADVFASADPDSLADAVAAADLAAPREIATNAVAVLVAPGNPGEVETIPDLSLDGVLVALCAPEVPCGTLAIEALDAAGIDLTPRTLEPSARAVVTKITTGTADAGVAYVTDGLRTADEGVTTLPFETDDAAIYAITNAAGSEGGGAFVEFVLSETGRRALADAGFEAP